MGEWGGMCVRGSCGGGRVCERGGGGSTGREGGGGGGRAPRASAAPRWGGAMRPLVAGRLPVRPVLAWGGGCVLCCHAHGHGRRPSHWPRGVPLPVLRTAGATVDPPLDPLRASCACACAMCLCLCPVPVTGCLCPAPVPCACALRHRIPEVPNWTVRVLCWDN